MKLGIPCAVAAVTLVACGTTSGPSDASADASSDATTTGDSGASTDASSDAAIVDATAVDAPADAAPDGAACPPGTCFPPGRQVCEAPGGPTGNGCCACGADGQCSSPCKCAAPDTPIATPAGDRPIASLAPGDLVYSVDRGAVRAVPLLAVQRVGVQRHKVVRVALASGVVLRISPGHPTADGRVFGDLREGSHLDGQRVLSAELVDHAFDATWDILPASDTGTYFAGGALIGTTMPRGAAERHAGVTTCR